MNPRIAKYMPIDESGFFKVPGGKIVENRYTKAPSEMYIMDALNVLDEEQPLAVNNAKNAAIKTIIEEMDVLIDFLPGISSS